MKNNLKLYFMEDKEILEGNKLILEIMGGWEIEKGMENEDNPYYTDNWNNRQTLDDFIFSDSWDALMPVVKKCCELNGNHACGVFNENDFYNNDVLAVFKSCVKFIKKQANQKIN